MNGKKPLILVVISIIIFVLYNLNNKEIILGCYEYHGNHTSILTLKPDGSFIQEITTKDKVFSINGNWKQKESAIDFSPFCYSVDLLSGDKLDTPLRVGSSRATYASGRLIFRDDGNYTYKHRP